MRMDNFDVILGMEFLAKKGSIPIPSISSLLIKGEKPGMVLAIQQVPELNLFFVL